MREYFEYVCNKLNLGIINEEIIQIYGGKTNRLFKVSTTKGKYAIKIISKSNIEKNKNLINNLEITEQISNLAKSNNINVISAIKFNNKYIQKIKDQYLLIYDWYEGDMLYNLEINIKNIKDIARELAKFHKLPFFKNLEVSVNERINFKNYLEFLKDLKEDWSDYILNRFEDLILVYEKSYNNYLKLTNQKSLIHGDLSSKNILLVDDEIYMIDWETSKVSNPSIDFFYTSWFGIGTFDECNYYNFVKEYLSLNELLDDVNISSYASLTEEFAWLELCIKRALKIQTNDEYEVKIGKDSAVRSLTRILDCYEKIPKMLEIIKKVKQEKDNK